MLTKLLIFCAKKSPSPLCTIDFGAMSPQMVFTAESCRWSERKPSGGTKVVVGALSSGVLVGLAVG